MMAQSPSASGPSRDKRAILQIAWGPWAARKIILEKGQVLRFGRTESADVVLSHDRGLAGVHFEIDWDGVRSEVRDRSGRRATFVGGERVERAFVPHGSFVQAGETTLMFHVEDHTPPREPPPELDDARKAALAGLRAEPNLWGILDAARDERIFEVLKECVDDSKNLYEGPKGDSLAEVAPHLVKFRADSHLLELVVREGWGASWGIFFSWADSAKELRRHLRRFLIVEDEQTRKRLYFRFYDPRVLRTFLPTCTVRQLGELFGDIDALLLEGEDGALVRHARGDIESLAMIEP
jgi:hypothetical protein